jgi:Transposase, Mutator family
MEQNENLDGWRWFLEHLREGVPTLVLPHPRKEVMKKYFTFISDRQKGLRQALTDIFPENHSCYCAVHIARNVQVKFGKKMSKYVMPLSQTFSPSFSAEILSKMTEDCRKYVEDIPASAWRNTEWLRDKSLPPRYGVRTSNMSEFTNSMFEPARDCSWLQSIHTIVTKMMERIVEMRLKHKDNVSILESVVSLVEKRWEFTAQYRVRQLKVNGKEFIILRNNNNGRNNNGSCAIANVDMEHERCTCGEWQDRGIPCIPCVHAHIGRSDDRALRGLNRRRCWYSLRTFRGI